MDPSLPESFASEEITSALGEPLSRVLDVSTWSDAADLAKLYASLRQVVEESVEQERRTRDPIRRLVLDRLCDRKDRWAPANAGLYRLEVDELRDLHAGLLFNGAVECCDGTMATHDTLVLAVMQVGIALVAYQGQRGSWVQRFYHRDLTARYPDPVQEALALLERRGQSGGGADGQPISRLLGRAVMEYGERAALLDLSDRPWRMGHGNPIPLTMLVPSYPELLRAGIDTLQRLIFEQKRFVYVASEPADRLMLTLGDALQPLEFAIVETLMPQFSDSQLERLAESARGHPAEIAAIGRFLREVRTEVVRGVYRAGDHAPARVFYAHREFACEAAAIAIADSVLQAHRGFPMLIDLADLVCRNTFDSGSFSASIQDAYAAAKEPLRYLGERETRS